MKHTQHEWDVHLVHYDGYYADLEMYRHAYHDITITYYREEKDWYAIIRTSKRSDGPYGDFVRERHLPQRIVERLRAIAEPVLRENNI